MALGALACAEKSDSVASTPSDRDLTRDASAQNDVTDPSVVTAQTDEADETGATVASGAADAPTDETDAPALPATSEPSSDAAVGPIASVPVQGEPSSTESDAPSLGDAGQTPPSASSPEGSVPTNDVDARAPMPEPDAGEGVPNVPTEFPLLPVECSDIPSMTEEGRCITQRSCDTLRQYNAACDGTLGDLYCTCINDGYPSRLQFSQGSVEQACEASLLWCDPARGLSLGTRVCEPPTDYISDDYCWQESECGYEWQFEDAIATSSQPRTEGATCSFNADTQRWECDCTLEGVTWVNYSFAADASMQSVCGDAYDVCEDFASMVPEFGAECSAGDSMFSEQMCRSEFECRYPANVGGRRVSVTSQLSVSCRYEDAEFVCTLGAQRDGTKVSSLSPNPNEACVAFSADEIVGLASLPKPATE